MVEVTQEAIEIEEAAVLLDDALREPCSIEMAERILKALAPIIDRHRQAGVQQGLDMAAAALESDAKLCDCHARSEGECACGAWCEWKSITSARAVEIVRKLGGDDGTD